MVGVSYLIALDNLKNDTLGRNAYFTYGLNRRLQTARRVIDSRGVEVEGMVRTLTATEYPLTTDDETRTVFYQHVLYALPFALVVFNFEHRYRFCNPSAIKSPKIRQWIIGKDDFEYCSYRGFEMALAETRRHYFLQAIE